MDFLGWWIWPFGAAFFGIWMIIGLALLAFWIWMLVDVIRRKFRNTAEKIIWIILMIFGGWIASIVYFFAIRQYNKSGLMKK